MVFSKILLSASLICSYHFRPPAHVSSSGPVKPKLRAYYISPSGSDLWEGTKNKPIKSIRKINSIPLQAGDSVLFEAGQHFSGSLQLRNLRSDDSAKKTFISSYGKGFATIESGNESAIIISLVKWLNVMNLKLVGSGRKTGNTKNGLAVLHSSHMTLDSLEISGFQKAGLHIGFCENISVTNMSGHDNGFAGIAVEGKDGFKKSNQHIYIGHCIAENNPGDPSNLDNHSGNGIVVSNCTNTLIEYCTATNNGWDMPRKGNGPVGIWAFEADSVTIQHCLSYRNKTSAGGADGGGFDFDGGVTNSVIQYCLSYENQGAGYCMFQYLYASPWHDNIFRYNISENDGTVSDAQAGIFVWNSSLDSNQFFNNLFYNNTIYNSNVSAISYSELSRRKGFAFYNNIFVGKGNLIKGNPAVDIFISNNWWDSAGINPDFKNAGLPRPQSADELTSYNAYAVPLNSSLRNSGLDLSGQMDLKTGAFDFNGEIPPVRGIGASFKTCPSVPVILDSLPVAPFAVIQYSLKIKCRQGGSGYSFIRFFDSADRLLLEYRSSVISVHEFQDAGYYTEAPPDTRYALIGLASDSGDARLLDTAQLTVENNIGRWNENELPLFNLDEYLKPFWNTDTVFNETVLLYASNGQAANGRLLFNPDRIISVRSFDLSKTFQKNSDYTFNGRQIIRPAGSAMPFRADTSFDRKNNLAWYDLRSQWVVVTYTHHDKWTGPKPVFKGSQLPRLMAKLKQKERVKIIGYGMSITRGQDVSGFLHTAPYMPTYLSLFCRQLRKNYGYDQIELINAGLPGALVSWGAENADKYINPVNPDLVIIDFGMNDFWRYSPAEFKGYVETIISKVKAVHPEAEFLLVSNMDFDPDYILSSDKNRPFYISNMQGYKKVLGELETEGIVNLDMTTISDAIYTRKKAKDCINNPLHPNDYLARWYAQGLVAMVWKENNTITK